jgi:uncharacterized membrane protein YccC
MSSIYQNLRQEFELARVRPAMEAGLRCAVAMVAPIAIGEALGRVPEGLFVAGGAWFGLLADVGGTYRQKGIAMVGATIVIAVSILVAGFSAIHPLFSLALLFCWIFWAGFAPLFGATPAQISFLSCLTFIIGMNFARPATAFGQAFLYLVGGLWGTTLSLLVWSIHPNRLVREAVNRLYNDIADLLRPENVRRSVGPIEANLAIASTLSHFSTELSNSRVLWQSMRSRRNGLSEAERLLLIAVTNSQQTLRSVLSYLSIASTVLIDSPDLEPSLIRLTNEFQLAARLLGQAILNRKSSPDLGDMQRALETLDEVLERRRADLYVGAAEYHSLLTLGKCVRQAFVVAGQFDRLAELLGHPEQVVLDRSGKKPSARRAGLKKLAGVVRANLSLRSATLRYALRLSIVTVIAEVIGQKLPGGRGLWVPITALVILKPDYGGTFSRTIQRVVGTVIGGLIGAFLGATVQTTTWQTVLIAFLAFFAFTVRPLNYGVFTLALTPLFMMLLNLLDKGDWKLSVLRILETWIGAGLALIGAYLVLPSWQRAELPIMVTKLIRSNAAYFRQVIDLYLGGGGRPEDIDRLHLASELASTNAEAVLQRLQSDPIRFRDGAEEWTTLILYLRSLTNSLSSLAEHGREIGKTEPLAEVVALADAVVETFEILAKALETGKAPTATVDLEGGPAALRTLVEKLHAARLEERAQPLGSERVTATLKAVRENTFLSREIDQIINKLTVIQETVAAVVKVTGHA